MAEDQVLLDISERIATITFNRPEARNALSSDVLRLLPELLRRAEASDDVDVIVLTSRNSDQPVPTSAEPALAIVGRSRMSRSRSSAQSTALRSPAASNSRSTATSSWRANTPNSATLTPALA
jgi:hypothetical protein